MTWPIFGRVTDARGAVDLVAPRPRPERWRPGITRCVRRPYLTASALGRWLVGPRGAEQNLARLAWTCFTDRFAAFDDVATSFGLHQYLNAAAVRYPSPRPDRPYHEPFRDSVGVDSTDRQANAFGLFLQGLAELSLRH